VLSLDPASCGLKRRSTPLTTVLLGALEVPALAAASGQSRQWRDRPPDVSREAAPGTDLGRRLTLCMAHAPPSRSSGYARSPLQPGRAFTASRTGSRPRRQRSAQAPSAPSLSRRRSWPSMTLARGTSRHGSCREDSSLFDERALAGLPTFLTTNLSPRQMPSILIQVVVQGHQ
jgi:hypothetical protein